LNPQPAHRKGGPFTSDLSGRDSGQFCIPDIGQRDGLPGGNPVPPQAEHLISIKSIFGRFNLFPCRRSFSWDSLISKARAP
jgi:hypothetical protein